MRALLFALMLFPATAQAACEGSDDFLAQVNCLEGAYKKADKALNAAWPKVLAQAPSGGVVEETRKSIRASQRAWIAFRDADCAAKSMTGVPKYWRSNELSCLIEHTDARTKDLLETYTD